MGRENRYAGISAFGFGERISIPLLRTILNRTIQLPWSRGLQNCLSSAEIPMKKRKDSQAEVKALLEINDGIPLKDIAYSLSISSENQSSSVLSQTPLKT